MGFYYDSLADCNTLIEIDQLYSGAFYIRGCTHEKLDELDKAISDYTAVLSLDPNHVNAVFARGACLNKKGEFHRAIEDYKDALKKDEARQLLTIQRFASKRRSKSQYGKGGDFLVFNQDFNIEKNSPGIIREDETIFKTTSQYKYQASVKIDTGNVFKTITTLQSDKDLFSSKKDFGLETVSNFMNTNSGKIESDVGHSDKTPIECADMYHDEGFLARKKGQFDTAIISYSKALEIYPNHHKVFFRYKKIEFV